MEKDIGQKTEVLARELEASLSIQYGAILSAPEIQKVLGYPSEYAYRQAVNRKTIPVPIFELKHRRGKFALLRDVVLFLACVRLGQPCDPSIKVNNSVDG